MNINQIIEIVVGSIFGFGIALYMGQVLFSAVPGGSLVANTIANIIGGVGVAVSTVWVPMFGLFFLFLLYSYAKKSGVPGTNALGHKS